MNIKIKINWKQYDPQGNLINETEHDANSLVAAFIGFWAAQWTTVTQTVKDTGGVNRLITHALSLASMMAGIANDAYGIIVGTSDQAVAIADFNLIAKIAHGAGGGQLQYGVVTSDAAVTTDGSTMYYQLYRNFTNTSGGNITIKEVGIVTINAGTWYNLVDRSLSEYTINNGNSATITYKVSITV